MKYHMTHEEFSKMLYWYENEPNACSFSARWDFFNNLWEVDFLWDSEIRKRRCGY